MKEGINVEKFCREDNIKVSQGIMTGMIRPAGRNDVFVTISGLDFNTPDTFIFNYLGKFDRVMNQNVIYSKYREGPFKGKFNGERKYNMDFTESSQPMGTFHIIDGAKVRVFYRGNIKTCGRCHRFSEDCQGDGIAADCEEAGGERVNLSDWMKKLWKKIGFTPEAFELSDDCEKKNDISSDTERFPKIPEEKSKPKQSDVEKYRGVTVKNFPSSLKDEEILDFLDKCGALISAEKNNINIRRGPKTSSATIEGIDPNEVIKITEAIDFPQIRTKFFNVPLYCRPLRGLTPTKNDVTDDPKETNDEPIVKENLVDTVPLTPENNKKNQQVKKKPGSQNSPGNNILVGGVKFFDKNKDALSEFDFGEGCDEHSDELENFKHHRIHQD